MLQLVRFGFGLVLLLLALGAHAHSAVDIGFIGTLSTPAGYIGEDQRDALKLAIQEGGGKLGGVPVHLIVKDDGLKPLLAVQLAEKMLQEGVRLFTGVNFSNVMVAVAPVVTGQNAFFVSLNAGPSILAGKNCHPNFFSVAQQNDANGAVAATAANNMGIETIVIMAPAYHAGRDVLAAFRQAFHGKILAEMQTKLDQSDFSNELSRIRELEPQAVFNFLPGSAGVDFARQFAKSGLSDSTRMITQVYSMDRHMLEASGDASAGYYLVTQWTDAQDNPANRHFVAAFEKEYQRRPTIYAAMAYDTAQLIGSALKAVDGDIESRADEFRAALRQAAFHSVRGKFRFGDNQYPVQDWFLVQLVPDAQGQLDYQLVTAVAEDYTDPYGSLCTMP